MKDTDWAEIFILLMARLAPIGVELNPDDVVSLPAEFCLHEDRQEDCIHFTWISLEEAYSRANPSIIMAQRDRPTVSELQGRYMKLACLLLWKRAKGGISISLNDASLIPEGKFLFEDGITYKWLPIAEGKKLMKREKDNEDRTIVSKVAL